MDSLRPEDVGNATSLRMVNLGDIHSISVPAPEGYEWIGTPGGGGMFGIPVPTALLCIRCAALVGIAEAHNAWHDWLREVGQR